MSSDDLLAGVFFAEYLGNGDECGKTYHCHRLASHARAFYWLDYI